MISDGTTTALVSVALGALAVGMVLQVIGAIKGAREHGWGRARLFAQPALPWTLASSGALAVSVLCCLPIVWS
ncbi:hypothetical protein [Clavibacter nebraskensis]|uniref:Uncharacterized protein n=2 Tax=Clavibacter nebraskensis TaxID=31963 RepID=A0A399PJZ8_9MICO|nr:hypothetical protein [Clavibacter nebraskensis]KXU19343.1 hypothetical protein VV38_13955 [Clavibacter nebraskensis]OAH19722.1 hypothetical protein A3Q38_07365 [Clavibacter nebraskensis]QGV67894.1 hypothetical protein EGX36_14370 [Clavibacter nebraskensis]QGV70693.1 hypothetical protein EGX37_14325 [Clavibacter nebraskensis]QGV73484.1 hypothetical protein EGX35_14325 [Clavibacter nebraskensis]